MIRRSKLVWKLSAAVVAILAVAIALSGYVNNLIYDHYSLESARTSLRFNTDSINKGIGQLMMNRDIDGIQKLIADVSRGSTIYRDLRLVSHLEGYHGQVVASRSGATNGETLVKEDRYCAVCHNGDKDDRNVQGTVDMVIDRHEEEGRILSVMAPILYEERCVECHSALGEKDTPNRPIMGFLSADYSLKPLDVMVAKRRLLIIATVLASLLLGVIALRVMFTWLLERPIAELIAGTKRIAASQFDFRFDQNRDDEIGILEKSFNTMTATIQASQYELRGAKDYLQGIVENSADIIITVTSEGLIQTFNHGAEQALGYSRREVIDTHIETLFVDPRERDLAIARLKDTDNVKNYETRFRAKDGQVRNVLLTLSRLRDPDGNACGTFGISKDITQEKELQRELLQAQKFVAIGQAVTGIQHAVKNMLGVLTGGAYLVSVGVAKDNRERIEEGNAMVKEGIEQITAFSGNMLNYAKEWKPERERVNLDDMVAKTCESNRQAAANQGVALRYEASEGLPGVLCDPKLIHMAVTDILVNAVDACTSKEYGDGESPEMVLKNSLTDDGDFFVIELRDNGCGMTEEVRGRIFQPFFTTKDALGTGLGLALTARIINAHGGKISVESEPNRGATFRIHLPIHSPKDDREMCHGQASSRN